MAYHKTIATQPDRAREARKLAEAYIEYEDVEELAAHIEAVLHLWQVNGFELGCEAVLGTGGGKDTTARRQNRRHRG